MIGSKSNDSVQTISTSAIALDRKQLFFVQHSTVVKLYSPLFIRCCANQYNLTVTAKGVKRRARQRFEAQLKTRKMGTALSPGAMPVMPDGPKAEKPEEPWRENLNMHVICRECKEVPPNIVEEFSSGDMVCGSCGLVLGDRIVDTRSEWRTFSNDDGANDDPSRVGDVKNDLLNGDQLTTTIAFGDGLGRSRDLHRAQNKSTHDKSNKTLLAAYKEIGALCDVWDIPKNVSDTAKHLFKMVNDAGAFRGKSQEAIIAGCIFIACRQCKVPRTFREIFRLTNVSKKEIGRIFKALEKFFAAQNKEKMENLEKDGSKSSFLASFFYVVALTVLFKGSLIQTIPITLLRRPGHRSCAFATAVSSVYHPNVPWCRSNLRIS